MHLLFSGPGSAFQLETAISCSLLPWCGRSWDCSGVYPWLTWVFSLKDHLLPLLPHYPAAPRSAPFWVGCRSWSCCWFRADTVGNTRHVCCSIWPTLSIPPPKKIWLFSCVRKFSHRTWTSISRKLGNFKLTTEWLQHCAYRPQGDLSWCGSTVWVWVEELIQSYRATQR